MPRTVFWALLLCSGLPERAAAEWRWTAAEGCLDLPSARSAIAGALGDVVPDDLAVDVAISEVAGGWRASLRVTAPDGVLHGRDLTSEASFCQSLDDAVVVVAALLIDEASAVVQSTSLAIASPTRANQVPDAPGLAQPVPDPAQPTPATRWTGTFRLGSVARIDELPGLAGAAVLEVEVEPAGGVPLVLSVGVWPPVESLREARGGRFSGVLAALGTCPRARAHAIVELGGCGSVSATYFLAEGLGVSRPTSAEGLALSVAVGVFGRVRVDGPFWVRASLGLLVPFIRPRATIEEAGVEALVHETAPVVPEGGIAVELRLD